MLPSSTDAEGHRPTLPRAELQEVAEKTGYSEVTVAWLYTSLVHWCQIEQPGTGRRRGLSADAFCETLIRWINERYPGDLTAIFDANQITRSEDIGAIIAVLIDRGLLLREEDDFFTDFEGLFETKHMGAYLAQHGIRRRWMDMPGIKRRLAIVLFTFGVASFLAGYFSLAEDVPFLWIGGVAVTLAGVSFFLFNRKAEFSGNASPNQT